ncbi:MAG TPA: hemerythrin domain-containing protein [Candidatus Obscuribacterales bacterium]
MDLNNQTRQYVLKMLQLDHKRLNDYFVQFDQSYLPAHKKSFAMTALNELAVHAHLEEEIFYPYVKTAKPSVAVLIDRSVRQHASIDSLIRTLDLDGDPDLFEKQFLELADKIKDHIRFEELQIFVQLADVDLGAIGPVLDKRRDDLMKRESAGNEHQFTPQTNLYASEDQQKSA